MPELPEKYSVTEMKKLKYYLKNALFTNSKLNPCHFCQNDCLFYSSLRIVGQSIELSIS